MNLTEYRTLGRSGLVVSPLALGTMTFGARRWGSDLAMSRAVFGEYIEVGGNFIDTADVYSSGGSEEMVGQFISDGGLRERVVLATKAGFNRQQAGNPNAGGAGSKNIHAALEGSLKRLQTDYVDLFWVHVWDAVTPAEELLQTLSGLVRSGKTRYYGLSNVPAWYVAKIATLANAHSEPAPVALQLEYSLTERSIEREHLPMAREFGIGLLPWSPLDGGFLTGKYHRDDPPGSRDGRLSGSNPFGDSKFNDRSWALLDVLRTVAKDVEQTPAQVALAWTRGRPGVTSTIIGASNTDQLRENIKSLEVELSSEQMKRLNEAGAPSPVYPYPIFEETVNRVVFGGTSVRRW